MAPKKSFRKAYVGIVMDMALARSKISNRMVAQRLDVDEITIRRWRKENPDLDRAFTEAKEMLMEKINSVAVKSLGVRKRKSISKGPKGLITTVEDVLPTHSDVAVFAKYLGMGSSIYGEDKARIDERCDILRKTMKSKVAGEITALEAAQLLEAEGIAVPGTLMFEIQRGNKDKDPVITLTPEQRAARVAELKEKLYGGTRPEPDAG